MRRHAVVLSALLGLVGCPGPGEERVPASPAPAPPAELAAPTALASLPAGIYRPLFPGKDEPREVPVAAFRLEVHPVTNAQFLAFVRANAGWRRSGVARLFADEGYLSHWAGDLELGAADPRGPVVNVSWFSARAYASWCGRRLPRLAEWEYAGAASETQAYGREHPAFNQRILDWYSRPSRDAAPPVRSTFRNLWGVWDLHGLVWEWVEDFNSNLVTGESRGDAGLDRNLFCGAGSIGSPSPEDYAGFMRFAFRSSLKRASYTTRNLGFRCAADSAPQEDP